MANMMNTTKCPHHPTKALEEKDSRKPFNCGGCKMGGIGKVHACPDKACNYKLHGECRFPTSKISPTCLQGNPIFKFKEKPPPLKHCSKPLCKKHGTFCDACGKPIKGFFYHCEAKNLALHPRCAMLEKELVTKDGLKFVLDCNQGKPNKCDLCSSKRVDESIKDFPGWCYVSHDNDYNCHVYCFMDMILQSWEKAAVVEGQYAGGGLDLEKLELPPIAKKKKSGNGGSKYWKFFKVLLTTIFSILFGDPTTLLAHFAGEGIAELFKLT